MHRNGLRIKSFDADDGTFIGYGSTFGGEPDAYGEVIAKGAFGETLKQHKKAGTAPKLLWQHWPDEPIGVYEEVKEDDKGLFVRGKLDTSGDVPEALKARALMRSGAVDGLSIGFRVKKFAYDEDTDIVTLTEIDLREVSVVTFPANPNATVTAVKNFDKDELRQALEAGEMPAPRLLERLFRDEGATRKYAKTLVARFQNSDALRDAESDELKALADKVGQLRLTQRSRLLTEQLGASPHVGDSRTP